MRRVVAVRAQVRAEAMDMDGSNEERDPTNRDNQGASLLGMGGRWVGEKKHPPKDLSWKPGRG
jgi:hypothetical protein